MEGRAHTPERQRQPEAGAPFSTSPSAFTATTQANGGPSPAGTPGPSINAAILTMAKLEKQLDSLIAQRKVERGTVAAVPNGGDSSAKDSTKPGDSLRRAKSGRESEEMEDGDDDNDNAPQAVAEEGEKQTARRPYNLDEGLIISMLDIPIVSSETMRAGHLMSTPEEVAVVTPTAANAAELVLDGGAVPKTSVIGRNSGVVIPRAEPLSILGLRSFGAPRQQQQPSPLQADEQRPGVVGESLRREIMGEVKAELLMEVERRERENMGKLYDLERENRELKHELHGMLREMREERRRKEREREERRETKQRRSSRLRKGRSESDSESSSDAEEEERGRGGHRKARDSESEQRQWDKQERSSSRRDKRKAKYENERESEEREPRESRHPPPLPPSYVRSDSQRMSRQLSGSGSEEWTTNAAGSDSAAATSMRTARRRKRKGRRAAEEIEHDNEERWQTRVEELRAFAKEYGHCRVPKNYPNRPLYTWTQNVRQRWRRGAVSDKKIQDLISVGMQNPLTADEIATPRPVEKERAPQQAVKEEQQLPPEEKAAQDVDQEEEKENQEESSQLAVDNNKKGRLRAVKRSKRGKRTQSTSTTKEGDDEEKEGEQEEREGDSDGEYSIASDKEGVDEDDEEEDREEEEEEEEEEKGALKRRSKRPNKGQKSSWAEKRKKSTESGGPQESGKQQLPDATGVVTRRKAKTLTAQEPEEDKDALGKKRKSMPAPRTVTEMETEEGKKKAKRAKHSESEEREEVKSEATGEAGEDEGQEVPDSPANQKWIERFEALKEWRKKHGNGRPSRKHEPSLGRWADEQMNRLKAGDLLPWRRKLLDEVRFFEDD